jgi:single-strand DNA-binding protein
MKDVNKVILIGRLGADPIQRFTKAGTSVVHFSVATSRKIFREDADPSKEATWLDETQWHRVIAWGKRGEACFQYLKKGDALYVEGYIKSRNYNDQEGTSKTSFEIHAEDVSFLGSRRTEQKQELDIMPSESIPEMTQ